MKLMINTAAGLLAVAFATHGYAEEERDRTIQFGISPFGQIATLTSDEGDSESRLLFSPIGFVVKYPFGKKSALRVFADYYDQENFDATTTDIGQRIEGFSFSALYSRQFALSRGLKPWLSAGLSVDNFEYTSRHLVDSDGFLTTTYENREETEMTLLFGGSLTFGEASNFELDLLYKLPMDTGADGLMFRFSFYPGFVN